MRTTHLLPFIGVILAMVTLTAQAPGIRPIASVRQLHDAMITPASDAIFSAASEPPTTDAGWTAVRNHAVVLAESGNLLMVPGRAKDKGDWMKFSAAMAEAAARALRGAEARAPEALLKASDDVAAICEACHEPYRDGGRKMGPPPK